MAKIGVIGVIACCGVASAYGQAPAETPPSQPSASAPPSTPEEPHQNIATPCVQPPPIISWQDYQGPFAKVVAAFGRKIERQTVHPPHPPEYKPGVLLCTFTLKSKFRLTAEDMVDPFTILNIAFNAGISQAENDDPTFGQGASGYGKRMAAASADQASGDFFKFVVYPTVFSEDPRYYRLVEGSGKARLAHALKHSVLAHRDNGTRMFNFSEWLGTTSAVVLSNVYHPGNKRGVGPAAQSVGINVATDTGFDVLREFWPDIARKLHLPFRDESEPKI